MNKQEVIDWTQGNFGAMDFLLSINPIPELIYAKLKRCTNIRSWQLYVLWNDLCDRNLDKLIILCQNCPDAILEDACSRQDRSGVELISEYLTKQES